MIDRLIIGKRVTVGAIVAGALGLAAYLWGLSHEPIPAHVVIGIGAPITAALQVWIANRFAGTRLLQKEGAGIQQDTSPQDSPKT